MAGYSTSGNELSKVSEWHGLVSTITRPSQRKLKKRMSQDGRRQLTLLDPDP
jgi:hypothetical protein